MTKSNKTKTTNGENTPKWPNGQVELQAQTAKLKTQPVK
jgi:hypothetical protein